jgi:protein-disulfide isomerase
MAKRSAAKTPTAPSSGDDAAAPTLPRPGVLVGLTATAFLVSLLALYQWMELIVAYSGGELSCAIGEVFDCGAVWSSAFAKGLHSSTGVPVAGWGLVWGLVAIVASLRLWHGVTPGAAAAAERVAADVLRVRVIAGAGVLACLGFAGVSLSLGSICLTCVGTYWLAFTFAVLAWRLPGALRPDPAQLPAGVGGALALVVLGYLLVLAPGRATPQGDPLSLARAVKSEPTKPGASIAAAAPATRPAADPHAGAHAPPPPPAEHPHGEAPPEMPRTLSALLDQMPKQTWQLLSDALNRVRASKPVDTTRFPLRYAKGKATAPAHVVEFTDIRCGHCARLMAEMKEIQTLVPDGTLRIEPRQFPLDAECNPSMPPTATDGSGVRCAAAKSMICLEGHPKYWDVAYGLFEKGPSLSKEVVLDLAGAAFGGRPALERCVAAAATQEKLAQDVAYAEAYGIEGTPLLLINGRKVEPVGALIYALLLAGGDPNHAEFARLPPPRPGSEDPHAGHGH